MVTFTELQALFPNYTVEFLLMGRSTTSGPSARLYSLMRLFLDSHLLLGFTQIYTVFCCMKTEFCLSKCECQKVLGSWMLRASDSAFCALSMFFISNSIWQAYRGKTFPARKIHLKPQCSQKFSYWQKCYIVVAVSKCLVWRLLFLLISWPITATSFSLSTFICETSCCACVTTLVCLPFNKEITVYFCALHGTWNIQSIDCSNI